MRFLPERATYRAVLKSPGFSGARRTREFAMRIALGAQSIRRRLCRVDPIDAPAPVSAEAILIGVSLLAAMGPAIRATRADPVDLLRST